MDVSELTIVVSGSKQTGKKYECRWWKQRHQACNVSDWVVIYVKKNSFEDGLLCTIFMSSAAAAFFDQKKPQVVTQFMVLARKT